MAATSGNDTLKGGILADTLAGLGGNDSLFGDLGSDKLDGGDGDDTLNGYSGADLMLGGAGNDVFISNGYDGTGFADTMNGGDGNDTYFYDDTRDIIVEGNGVNSGRDTVYAGISLSLAPWANVEVAILNPTTTGTAALTLTGNDLANVLIGNGGNNTLTGGIGNDSLEGGAGNDVLLGGTEADTLVGGDGADSLDGGTGNDKLEGGAGADTLIGGAGDDLYIVGDNLDTIIEANDTTKGLADKILSTVTIDLSANTNAAGIDNIELTGTGIINVKGNSLGNYIKGNAQDNTLDGFTGADTMEGGLGNDTYVVNSTDDMVVELVNQGSADTVKTSIAYDLSVIRTGEDRSGIENLTSTSATGLSLTGNTSLNKITGGAGNDSLNGMAGADTMEGGAGNDVYTVDNSGDVVIEANDTTKGLTDKIISTVAIDLSANVNAAGIENIELTGAGIINAKGNSLANYIKGNAQDNTLDGFTGADTMEGGLGNDTYLVNSTDDMVRELSNQGSADTVKTSISYDLSAIRAGEDRSGIDNLTSTTTTGLILTGNSAANTITGGVGNDTLDGGANSTGVGDILLGGNGSDVYYVNSALDRVADMMLNDGWDKIFSKVSLDMALNGLYQGIEEVELTGLDPLSLAATNFGQKLIGNEGKNSIRGGSGNDTLNGMGGADAMSGGTGSDTYYLDDVGDQVYDISDNINDVNQIISTLTVNLTKDIGYSEIDHVQLLGSNAANIVGNDLDNKLEGNSAANSISGGAGNDTLDGKGGADGMAGGTGDDSYYVDSALDRVVEFSDSGAIDAVYSTISYDLTNGGVGEARSGIEDIHLIGTGDNRIAIGNELNNHLFGSIGNDLLRGDEGDDTLYGDAGNDTMLGGTGDDSYYIDSALDRVVEFSDSGAIDAVYSTISYDLTKGSVGEDRSGIEDIHLIGTGDNRIAIGNELNNHLFGSVGNDSLRGDEGDDTLNGDVGNDTMIGGTGDDSYYIDSALDRVVEYADSGAIDAVYSTISYDLLAGGVEEDRSGIEDIHLIELGDNRSALGNELDNQLFGSIGKDSLVGREGNDLLDGGIGSDTMDGGQGSDTYYVDNIGDVVLEADATDGYDLVYASINYDISNNASLAGIDQIELTGAANLTATGNALNNSVLGNSGNNILSGLAGDDDLSGADGNDTMSGGLGDDLMDGGAGNDSINGDAGGDYILGGLGMDTLNGGAGTDMLFGDEDADSINGNAGDDEIHGGDGNDILMGADTLSIRDGDDQIYGDAGNDILMGSSGNDTLDGGLGDDTMTGGVGSDVFYVDSIKDVVNEAATDGARDLVYSDITFSLVEANMAGLEDLSLTGYGDNNATGNGLANVLRGNWGSNLVDGQGGNDSLYGEGGLDTLTGGAGDDYLDGGSSGDSMVGGIGNDTYVVDSTEDLIREASTEGANDAIETYMSFNLASARVGEDLSGIEQLRAKAASDSYRTYAFQLQGNALANTIIGLDGDDVINGASGNDTIIGAGGNDSLVGEVGTDNLQGGEGGDSYYFYGEFGLDVVSEQDNSAIGETLPSVDEIFLYGADSNHVWLAKSGMDLVITDVRTNAANVIQSLGNQVTVAGWFADASKQVEYINAKDGYWLDPNAVNAAVSAMAAFTPTTGATLSVPQAAKSLWVFG